MLIITESLPESILAQFPQYTRNVGFFRFTPYQVLVDLMLAESIKPNSTVMDAGCGINSVIPINVFGVAVDVLCKSVRTLKKNRRDLNCICASLEALPFKQVCFDIIVSKDVIEHCNSTLAIKEIGRVLKPSGEFITSTSNIFSPIFLFDQYFNRFTDRIAEKTGSKYFQRIKHLNPYSLRSELAQAGLTTKRLFMVTTPPLLTVRTWREFVKRFPWKLIPWLVVSMSLKHFRIFRETLVAEARKCVY
jgi:SAM-dependent methyltransferase